MDAMAELDKLVQEARAELETMQNQGPSPDWEVARDRTARAIVSAESRFDRLALHYGVIQTRSKDLK
jgi:hypothetical protein